MNQTRTSSKVNEITGISETVGSSWIDPAYDAAGNMITGPMITGPLGTDPTTKLHFVFDAWNRMVTVKADSSGSPGSTIASYTYDGRNRRITKTIGGHTYHGYYNNNWQYLETRIGTSTSSSGQLVWDLRYIDSPLALLGGTYPLYYTNDANFNVTALIDGHTGAVSERYQYDPYGKVQFYSDAWVKTMASAANNPILYCGYTLDSESGLYLARNRYLNVGVGVWEKRDSKDYIDSSNFYEYVKGNPTSYKDGFGLAVDYPDSIGVQWGWYVWGRVTNKTKERKVTILGDYQVFVKHTDDGDEFNNPKTRSTVLVLTINGRGWSPAKNRQDWNQVWVLNPGEASDEVRTPEDESNPWDKNVDHIQDVDYILSVSGATAIYKGKECKKKAPTESVEDYGNNDIKGIYQTGIAVKSRWTVVADCECCPDRVYVTDDYYGFNS